MKRCPAQSRTANAIDTTPAPRKDAAPAARPKGPAAKKAAQKHRPPVQEVSVVHLHGGTRFPHTESAPAATMSYTMQFSWLAPRGDRHPSSFAAYLLMGLPTMADFRPGGLRRFGASLRSQYRSCGVWLPLSFYADAWPVVGCTAAGDIGSTDFYLLVSDIILQESAVVNPPPYPSATSRIIITVKPAAKASAPGPESPRVGSSSAATT